MVVMIRITSLVMFVVMFGAVVFLVMPGGGVIFIVPAVPVGVMAVYLVVNFGFVRQPILVIAITVFSHRCALSEECRRGQNYQ